MKNLLFLFCVLLAHSHIAAKKNSWLVITAKNAFNQQSMPLTSGSIMEEDEAISLEEDSYLGLLHESGYYTFLEGSNKLKLSVLLEAALEEQEAAAFFHQASRLLKEKEEYKKSKKTGSVTCGFEYIAPKHITQSNWIAPYDVRVSWSYTAPPPSQNAQIQIILDNLFDDTLWSKVLAYNDTSCVIKAELLKKYEEMGSDLIGEVVIISLKSKSNNDILTALSFNKTNFLQGESEQYPALLKILQAFYMEAYGLPYDIESVYREAIALRPQVGYERFLELHLKRKSQ